jgi:hypothetical protein
VPRGRAGILTLREKISLPSGDVISRSQAWFLERGDPPSSEFVRLLLAHLMGYFRNKNLAIAQINQGDDPVV